MKGERKQMEKYYYNAQEVAEILGISLGNAYSRIKEMNKELERNGYLTIAGKVPMAYLQSKIFGAKDMAMS